MISISAQRSTSGMCLVDRDGRIAACDAAAGEYLGWDRARSILLSEVIEACVADDALARLAAGEEEVALYAPLRGDAFGAAAALIQMRRLEGSADVLALLTFSHAPAEPFLDALTGLPDRRAIANRLASWQGTSGDRPAACAVLFLDLDDFKRVNDQHGHAVGDRVLAAVAQRLVDCVRDGDLVVRYGGDEFVLLLKGVEAAVDAEPVIARLRQCAEEPVEVASLRVRIGASVGLAIAKLDADSIDAAIDAADRDMYRRKRRRPK